MLHFRCLEAGAEEAVAGAALVLIEDVVQVGDAQEPHAIGAVALCEVEGEGIVLVLHDAIPRIQRHADEENEGLKKAFALEEHGRLL